MDFKLHRPFRQNITLHKMLRNSQITSILNSTLPTNLTPLKIKI